MEEKKVYSIVGKVEIGTDEYRDLIESRLVAEKRADSYMHDGWEKDKKINELNKKVEQLTKKVEKCEKFFKNNHDATGDVISVFMGIFGDDE